MTPETKLKNDVQKFLLSLKSAGLPIWWFKVHACGYSKSGIPDLSIVVLGVSLWAELKTEKGKVSKIQDHRIDELRQAGASARVCRSVDSVAALILDGVSRVIDSATLIEEHFPTAGDLLKLGAARYRNSLAG